MRALPRRLCVILLHMGTLSSGLAQTLTTSDGLSLSFSPSDGSIVSATLDGAAIPLLGGGGLSVQVGHPTPPGDLAFLTFDAGDGSWTQALNSNWDASSGYATWQADGGVGDTGHLLLGNGVTNGAGMACAATIPVVPGSNLTISWSARVTSVDTSQILCVRVYDAGGSDITASSTRPSGWGYSSTSLAHYVAGIKCTATDDWEQFEQVYRVPEGAASARVSLRHWNGGDHWLRIDDLKVATSGGIQWAAPAIVRGPLTPVSGGFDQHAEVPGEGIHVDVAVRTVSGAIRLDLTLQDTSSPLQDRPLIARWTLPVAADGWQWWDDIGASRTIAPGALLSNTKRIAAHAMSQYPFSAITGGQAGLSLAVPMDGPVVQRFEGAAETGLRSVWELCLSPLTAKIGAGRATASVLVARHDAAWGFRSAAAKYHALFPDYFVKRTTLEGAWLWLSPFSPSQIPNPQDFGFAYHETHPISEADRAFCEDNGIGIFYYAEPFCLWMNWPDALVKPSYDDRVARLQNWATDSGSYANWQSSGGIDDSAHLLLGDGATVGVGMAITDHLSPTPGSTVRITWQSRVADTATLQILGVRVYDAAGADITSVTAAPSGWFWSSTSMAHVVSGIANTAADTWQTLAYNYVVPATAASLRVSVRHWTGGDHSVGIDDLQVTSADGSLTYLGLDFASESGPWGNADNSDWNSPGPMWYRVARQQAAQAVVNSAPLDAAGRYLVDLNAYLWQQGTSGGSQGWVINTDPDLSVPNAYTLFHDNFIRLELDRNDGVYIDSVTVGAGLGEWENRRSEHLAVTDYPLTFSWADGGASQLAPQAHNELLGAIASELHAEGKLVFQNLFPEAMRFHAHLADVMGSEQWLLVEADTASRIRRTLAGQRIVTNLLQFNWDGPYILYDEMETYIRGQLFWGFYPGVSSGGGPKPGGLPDRYFVHPEMYERDRPLFKKYIPLIRELSTAGWEPITYTWLSTAGDIERFGDLSRGAVLFTVRGSSGAAWSGEVSVDLIGCGLGTESDPVLVTDVLNGESLAPDREGGMCSFSASLAPGEVGMYRLRQPLADFNRDRRVNNLDFEHLRTCWSGACVPLTEADCADADLDGDMDVDQSDFGLFQRCISGTAIATPGCTIP